MAKLEFSIEGTFQAYGPYNSRTFMDYKPTGFLPSKTYMVGMIGAGLGYKKNSKEMANLDKEIDVEIKMTKQIQGIYRDFQTVSAKGTDFSTKKLYRKKNRKGETEYVSALEFYKAEARPEDKNRLPCANGNFLVEGEKKVVEKQYIIGGEFLVVVNGKSETLEKVRNGLLHPYYPLFLGRKCCVPSKVKVGEIQ